MNRLSTIANLLVIHNSRSAVKEIMEGEDVQAIRKVCRVVEFGVWFMFSVLAGTFVGTAIAVLTWPDYVLAAVLAALGFFAWYGFCLYCACDVRPAHQYEET